MAKNYKLLVAAVYLGAVAAIMLPWLSPGFLLTLDMVFASPMPLPTSVESGFLFYASLHWLSLILPADVLQKVLLAATFWLAGWGGFTAARLVLGKLDSSAKATVAAALAGLFYMINPFVYGRLMAGQFALLLAYALLPFVVVAAVKLLARPTWRNAVLLTGLLVLISIVSLHVFGMCLLLFVLGLLAIGWHKRRQLKTYGRQLKYVILVMLTWLVASSYWLLPLLWGSSNEAAQIASFTGAHHLTFQTVGGWLAPLFLQGFWADSQTLYLMPQDLLETWWLPLAGLLPSICLGCYALWQQQRTVAVWLIASIVIAALLAAGGLQWLAHAFPLLKGYREPQKFVAIISLGYAVAYGVGVWYLLHLIPARALQWVLGVVFAALVVFYTPLLFWGAAGQLQPRLYPADWHQARVKLQADTSRHRVLFLPWHLYMPYDFSQRTIATPATVFFEQTITSTNPEFGAVATEIPGSEAAKVYWQLLARPQPETFAKTAAQLGIKYILVAKSHDYARYDYLQPSPGLRVVQDGTSMRLYQNDAWGKQP